ncbi:hypothetical protein V6N13_119673 [Hibiscus sabdariffa]|uniref:Uncharacterized protein n=1 Tax=Hibiscus sabdariffa TaxID=183260 RepID=A0ABR2E1X5_9ROSI
MVPSLLRSGDLESAVMRSERKQEKKGQEIGTAGHASTSTSKGGTPANAVGNSGQVITSVASAVAPPLDSPPAPTSDQVTGTALRETAAPTISLAVLAVSNVVHSRTTPPEGSTTTFSVLEDPVAVIDPGGNPATGYAPGRDAMNTTLLAEWNVSDAVPQGT